MMWACKSTERTRQSFIEEVKISAPGATREMQKLTIGPRFHFVMGAGAKGTNREEWEVFQKRAAEFVEEVYNKTE